MVHNNENVHRNLVNAGISAEIKRFGAKQQAKLQHHNNVLTTGLLDQDYTGRTKLFELV